MKSASAALLLIVLLGPPAAAQDRSPPRGAPGGEAVAPGEGGGVPGGSGTAVPELMARTPLVARASELIGTEVLDVSSRAIGRVDDLLLRADGSLVVVVERDDGRLIGLHFEELVARAKLDRQRGSDVATIRSFRMAPASRRLGSAPEIEDKARLDAEWWKRLDAHGSSKPVAPEPAMSDDATGKSTPPTESGAQTASASDARASHLVLKQLLGCAAVDDAERALGTIKDVVVHVPDARIAYVLVTPATADATAATRAVPFDDLKGPREPGGPMVFSLDAGALDRSPPVADLDRLPVAPFTGMHGPSTPGTGTPPTPK